jgi:hypothetical protein
MAAVSSSGRVQAVVNALGGGPAARGDGAFQVDQPQVGALPGQDLQRHAPHVGEVHRARHPAVALLGQAHVVAGVVHPGFVQARVAGMRQDLVDAARRHHVAGEEQAQGHGASPRALLR